MSERETMLNLPADNRSTWEVFTDDPVMIAKMEKIGAELIRVAKGGEGRFFKLEASQVSIRPKRKPLSEEERARRAINLLAIRNRQ